MEVTNLAREMTNITNRESAKSGEDWQMLDYFGCQPIQRQHILCFSIVNVYFPHFTSIDKMLFFPSKLASVIDNITSFNEL